MFRYPILQTSNIELEGSFVQVCWVLMSSFLCSYNCFSLVPCSIEHFHVTSLPPCWRVKTIHFLSPGKYYLFSCKTVSLHVMPVAGGGARGGSNDQRLLMLMHAFVFTVRACDLFSLQRICLQSLQKRNQNKAHANRKHLGNVLHRFFF